MAGSDVYKEFDSASIVTDTTYKDSVRIGRYAFRKRELLLGLIAIIALILVIVLAIVLAIKGSEDDSCEAKACTAAQGGTEGSAAQGGTEGSTARGGTEGSTPRGGTEGSTPSPSSAHPGGNLPYCDSLECLKAAVYQKPIMNPEVRPCDNFYNFACGRYRVHHPQTLFVVDVTPINKIFDENTDNLLNLLISDVDKDHEHSYERKIKDFMTSCNNHFDKMDLRGGPLLQQIIQPLGGWYVLDTFVEQNFDFNDLLRRIHVEFWADPFFTLSTRVDESNWNNKIVELTISGMRLPYWIYSDIEFLEPYQKLYRSYIRVIARNLALDDGLPNDSTTIDRVSTFVNDVYEVESNISKIIRYHAEPQFDGYEPEKRVTLGDLSNHTLNTIDFVTFMKTLFDDWPSHFEADSKVSLAVLNYFDKIGALIASYLQTSEGKRILHNYMMWQAIEPYVIDLSWNYIHARRNLDHTMFGYKDSSSGYGYCFSIAEAVFRKGMSALYVKQHIKDEGKKEASEILTSIKEILMDRLSKLPWMTEGDRREAVTKIKDSLYKIGFPDDLVDEEYMDTYYYHVSIETDDYFGNVLAANKMHKKNLNNAVGQPNFKTAWVYHVFDPVIEYYSPWSELIVTAAMLQNPLFDAHGPTYYNYGGIGSRLASNLIHAVDEIGSEYKLDGSHFGTWWSNTTREHYQDIKECAIRKQKKEDFGKFKDFDGQNTFVNTSRFAPRWSPEVLADISGVRMALQAFKKHESGIDERVPPGFEEFTTTQMFFISYAQSFCQNVPEYIKTAQTDGGRLPYMNKVNIAMKNIPEFYDAFSCAKPDDSEECLLFGK